MFIKRQQEKWSALYHEYPRPFWMLVFITFIDRLGGALLYPFFALYLTRKFSIGMTEVGVLFFGFSVAALVGSTVGGALTDRLGRKGMMIFSLITTSLGSVLMGLAGSLEFFFLVAILIGMLSETGGPAHQAMLADLLPEEKRAQGFGLLRVAFNLSVTIGPAIGGFLAARSYLALFIADAIISLISAGLVLRFLPETKPQLKPGEEPESMRQTFGGYFQVLRDGLFMLFLGACILTGLVYMNMNTTLGVYLRDSFAVPEWGYGALLSLNALMVVLFQFAITRRIEGVPHMLILAVGTALYAIGFGMYGLPPVTTPFLWMAVIFALAMAILTIGEMLAAPTAQAVVAKLAPEHMRGRYMAIYGISWGLSFMVGPLLAGLWMDNANPRALWYIAGVLGFAAAGSFLLLHRLAQRSPAPSET